MHPTVEFIPSFLELGSLREGYIFIIEICLYGTRHTSSQGCWNKVQEKFILVHAVLFPTDTHPCAHTRANTHFQRDTVLILKTYFNFQLT